MIDRVRMRDDGRAQLGLALVGARVQLASALRREWRLRQDPAHRLRAAHQQVEIARIGEEARIDQRRIARIAARERDRAAAERTQRAHVQRIAEAPMHLAVVIVDQRGAEMQLQVGTIERRIALDEAARLRDVARHHPGAAREIARERGRHLRDPAQADADQLRRIHARVDDEVDMVDQVRADVRRILHDRDPVPTQLLGRTDARTHQQLRRIERACRQNHFRARAERLDAAVARHRDADRALAVEADAQHRRIGDHVQVRPVAAVDVGPRDAAARAVPMRDLVEADAFLRRAVEVVVERVAGRMRGLDESFGERIAKAQIRYRERPVRAVPRIGAALVAFRAAEIRQHVLPAPAGRAELRPLVVVARMAARIDHRVDRARAAHPAPARLIAAPPAETRLRHGLVAVVGAELERHERRDADRHVDQQIAFGVRARLDQRDGRVGARIGEAAGQARPARPATHDDVVVLHARLLRVMRGARRGPVPAL
ncbi:hypothetical protein FEQ04_05139 [Burkholderia pseudomultivorans]|nr:hypothetical protein [Burkholderia pseudomultivorans]